MAYSAEVASATKAGMETGNPRPCPANSGGRGVTEHRRAGAKNIGFKSIEHGARSKELREKNQCIENVREYWDSVA